MAEIVKSTPNRFVKEMTQLLLVVPPNLLPSQMIWGQPGVGKSAAVKQLVNHLNAYWREHKIKKIAILTEIRLPMFAPVDLRGVPAQKGDFAEWLKPKILDLKETIEINGEIYEVLNIFFMDEVSAALPSVQVCAYQITNDRCIGEHRLPNNTIPFLAGNRVTDKSVAYDMSKALCNRLTHREFIIDTEEWFDWAYENKMNPLLLAFLHYKPDLLNQFMVNGKVTNDIAFATPRSWKMADVYLKGMQTIKDAMPLIQGTVGNGPAGEFETFSRVANKLPKIEDLATGKYTQVHHEADINWSICTLIVSYVAKYNESNFTNVINYIRRMPVEFKTVAGKELLQATLKIKSQLQVLARLDAWKAWAAEIEGITNFRE